jgi:Spy/CpxP family protein refolding chaperone
MKLRLIAFFVVAATAAVLTAAQAPPPAGATAGTANLQLRARRLAALRGKVAAALGLSATQKQQIKTIRQQARLTAQPVTDQLKQNRQALTAAIKAGDAATIQALSKTQGELRGQALTVRSQAQAQIYAELTTDQRQKFEALRSRLQQKIAQRQQAN